MYLHCTCKFTRSFSSFWMESGRDPEIEDKSLFEAHLQVPTLLHACDIIQGNDIYCDIIQGHRKNNAASSTFM